MCENGKKLVTNHKEAEFITVQLIMSTGVDSGGRPCLCAEPAFKRLENNYFEKFKILRRAHFVLCFDKVRDFGSFRRYLGPR